jgi:hypothetical protein
VTPVFFHWAIFNPKKHHFTRIMKTITSVSTAMLIAVSMSSCYAPQTKNGAVIGGLIGAGTGAIIGNQSCRPLEGAAIGGAIGALGGALVGSAQDDRDARYYGEGGYGGPRGGYGPSGGGYGPPSGGGNYGGYSSGKDSGYGYNNAPPPPPRRAPYGGSSGYSY